MSDQETVRTIDFGLLANFVHQVINPLNGVIGTLDNLIDHSIPTARTEQRLKAARAQLEQAVLLVRNLAFFSELGADGMPPPSLRTKKNCVLPQTIIEAALFFQELGLSNDIKIHLEDRETQYRIEGNPDLLRQVFMNIFDNAIKYGKRGTEIIVSPHVQKRTGALLVRISGSSIHIPLAERESIFDLGYRSQSALAAISSGTGLGLYICRVILGSIHGASIEVERSSPLGETVFLLRFPKFSIGPRR